MTAAPPPRVFPFDYGTPLRGEPRWRVRLEVGPGPRLALVVNDCLRKASEGDGTGTLYVSTNLELEWEEHHWIEARLVPGSAGAPARLRVTTNGAPLFDAEVEASVLA